MVQGLWSADLSVQGVGQQLAQTWVESGATTRIPEHYCSEQATECILVLRVKSPNAEKGFEGSEALEEILRQAAVIAEENSYGQYRPEFVVLGPYEFPEHAFVDPPPQLYNHGVATFGNRGSRERVKAGGDIDEAVCDVHAHESSEPMPVNYSAYNKVFFAYEDSWERLYEGQARMHFMPQSGLVVGDFVPIVGDAGHMSRFEVVDCSDRSKTVSLDLHVGSFFVDPSMALRADQEPLHAYPYLAGVAAHELMHPFRIFHTIVMRDPNVDLRDGRNLERTCLMSTAETTDVVMAGPHRLKAGWIAPDEVAKVDEGHAVLEIPLRAINTRGGEQKAYRLLSLGSQRQEIGPGQTADMEFMLEFRVPPARYISKDGKVLGEALKQDGLSETYGLRYYGVHEPTFWSAVSVRRAPGSMWPGSSQCFLGTRVSISKDSVEGLNSDPIIKLKVEPGACDDEGSAALLSEAEPELCSLAVGTIGSRC